MFETLQSGSGLRQLRMRDWLCVLLAITFLYNPFLAASSCIRGQSVSHLPSFRATVAASELLRFKPKENVEVLSAPERDVVGLFVPAMIMPAPISQCTTDVEDAIPPQVFFEGSLWFRPPPVVA